MYSNSIGRSGSAKLGYRLSAVLWTPLTQIRHDVDTGSRTLHKHKNVDAVDLVFPVQSISPESVIHPQVKLYGLTPSPGGSFGGSGIGCGFEGKERGVCNPIIARINSHLCELSPVFWFQFFTYFRSLRCGCPAQLYPLANLAGMAAHPRQTFLHFISGDEFRFPGSAGKNVAPVHVSWLLFYV